MTDHAQQATLPTREEIAKVLWRRRRHYEPTEDQLHGSVTGKDCLADADAFLGLCQLTEGHQASPQANLDEVLWTIEETYRSAHEAGDIHSAAILAVARALGDKFDIRTRSSVASTNRGSAA